MQTVALLLSATAAVADAYAQVRNHPRCRRPATGLQPVLAANAVVTSVVSATAAVAEASAVTVAAEPLLVWSASTCSAGEKMSHQLCTKK